MREQETASARRPTDIDEGDFMDDATLEAYLQALQVEDTVTTSEVSSHTVAAQPVNSQEEEDRLLAVCLQAAESDDYITQISYLNTAHTSVTREHESVRVLPLASVLAQQESDYVHKGSPQVRSSEWKAAQALDRKANLRKDPHLDTHNDQSSFSRHEPLLRALRSVNQLVLL